MVGNKICLSFEFFLQIVLLSDPCSQTSVFIYVQQKMPNRTGDLLIQSQGNATVTIMRPQKASPPLTGTFNVEFLGRRVEGKPVGCGFICYFVV